MVSHITNLRAFSATRSILPKPCESSISSCTRDGSRRRKDSLFLVLPGASLRSAGLYPSLSDVCHLRHFESGLSAYPCTYYRQRRRKGKVRERAGGTDSPFTGPGRGVWRTSVLCCSSISISERGLGEGVVWVGKDHGVSKTGLVSNVIKS